MEQKNRNFVGKKGSLQFHNGFVLHGTVERENDAGIFFRTEQKTSFVAWDAIKQLIVEG
jgi:hypothetical protein